MTLLLFPYREIQEISVYLTLDGRSSHVFSEAKKEVTVLPEASPGSYLNPGDSGNKITLLGKKDVDSLCM